uniref:Uncharacterized protein n=1 Tax=Astyanax mexicanus TaxID=7994 RepID=A0A3B1IW37_ASTMX
NILYCHCLKIFENCELVFCVKTCVVSGAGSCCCTGLSAKCVLSCLRKLDDTTKDLKHIWHLKGRSPEWTLRCLLRLERSAKDLPHSVQEKGRSPDATKALSQFWHLSAGCLKPWCALWCRRKLDGSENILPHCGQRKGFSPECVRR